MIKIFWNCICFLDWLIDFGKWNNFYFKNVGASFHYKTLDTVMYIGIRDERYESSWTVGNEK